MIFKNSIAVYLKLNTNLLRIHSPLSIYGDIQTHMLYQYKPMIYQIIIKFLLNVHMFIAVNHMKR